MAGADEVDHKLLTAVDRIGTALRSARQELATRFGMSALGVQVVLLLIEREDARVGGIADELGVASPTVSDAVAALHDRSLVSRRPDPADRRASLVALTDRGRALAGELSTQLEPIISTASAWDGEDRGSALVALMRSIAALHRSGRIVVDRSCFTCSHYDPGQPSHCAFLDLVLEPADHRVDCSDHHAA